MNVEIDLDRCQGHGKCYLVSPDLFVPIDDDEWGRAEFVAAAFDASDPTQLAQLDKAVISCPERAITVT